jgi:PPOX class probable FMN-dependent enzyme
VKAIDTVAALEALYPSVVPAAVTKVATRLTPRYRAWIAASRFLVLSTSGPDGTDGSPRGDVEPVVEIADDRTLLLPDWRGNNRLDSLRNIVADGRASLMFMVPGCANVVRANGAAILTADADLRARFERGGKTPTTVIVFTIAELYFQCAKAIMRSGLWSGEDRSGSVPTAGDFIEEAQAGFDGASYDLGYPEYARARMW